MQVPILFLSVLTACIGAAPTDSNKHDFTPIAGALPSAGSLVATTVAGTQNTGSHSEFQGLESRAIVSEECTKSEKRTIEAALRLCYRIALEAVQLTENDPFSVQLFYKTTIVDTIVGNVFRKVARECHSSSRRAKIVCGRDNRLCRKNTFAVTNHLTETITMCPLFFSQNEDVILTWNSECNDKPSQPTVFVHEMTHLDHVGPRGHTVDYDDDEDGYKFENVLKLPKESNLWHAATYEFFAQRAWGKKFNNC